MIYLSRIENMHAFVIEDSNHGGYVLLPHFYLGSWIPYYHINESTDRKDLVERLDKNNSPEYILFTEEKNLEKRVDDLKQFIPSLKFETAIEPSFMDKLLHWLNPRNANQTIYIYRTK